MLNDAVRRRATWRLLVLLAVLLVVLGGGWYLSRPATLQKISSFETAALGTVVQEVRKDVSNPAPLIATGTTPSAAATGTDVLTRAGIIEETNLQRKLNGNLPPLTENSLLDQIATERLNDMIAKQYFAHVSPTGSSAETVAAADGYNYIALGENLALGTFAGDAGVVGAWMGSPGHRANILNIHYTQIGVAAKDAIFEGGEAWIAVQVFGRPASDCPPSPTTLKAALDAAETELSDMAATLKSEEAKINGMSPSDPSYASAVASYNSLAAQYNALLQTTQANVNAYNAKVQAYNACLSA
jgi:uncharacterized protein YkwD